METYYHEQFYSIQMIFMFMETRYQSLNLWMDGAQEMKMYILCLIDHLDVWLSGDRCVRVNGSWVICRLKLSVGWTYHLQSSHRYLFQFLKTLSCFMVAAWERPTNKISSAFGMWLESSQTVWVLPMENLSRTTRHSSQQMSCQYYDSTHWTQSFNVENRRSSKSKPQHPKTFRLQHVLLLSKLHSNSENTVQNLSKRIYTDLSLNIYANIDWV